ncbi:Activator of Hsp90 ATPase 1-like protein [Pseudovibrio sp. FO-BEG1]|nr:Activator of Hsp90 ATPase 1-like protein [Pseudovibrio sp. FO-BEG1]
MELLFQMWADPDHMKHWGCPEGFQITEIKMDFREGGTWSTTMTGPDSTTYRMRGKYLKIDTPRLIGNTSQWIDEDGNASDPTTITMTFERLAYNRSRLIIHEAKFSTSAFKASNEEGWKSSLESLAAYLATQQDITV